MRRILAAFAVLALFTPCAWAQPADEKVIPDDLEQKAIEAAAPKGWTGGLNLGASLAFTHNRKVVGTQDGIVFQLGILLDGNYGYFGAEHEWLNELSIKETVSKTPSIDAFIKTQDELDFMSTYLYRPPAIRWLGPFARFHLSTAIFPGYDVRGEDTVIQKGSANARETVAAQEKIDLTTWFEPLLLRESAGAFALPLEREEIVLRFQLGLGAQEVLSQGGYVLTDDDTTPAVELTRLEDYQQIGAELEAAASGKARTYVTWSVVANLFQPFYSSIQRGKSGLELLNIALEAKVSVKLASWLSLDYVLSAKRIPLVIDEWQVQNGLLLTAGFSLL